MRVDQWLRCLPVLSGCVSMLCLSVRLDCELGNVAVARRCVWWGL